MDQQKKNNQSDISDIEEQSKNAGSDGDFNTMWKGTAQWMAPEVMGNNNYGFKADVYSFGIVMYELLTCRTPWKGNSFTSEIRDAVKMNKRPTINASDLVDAPNDFVAMMKICWDTNPNERPTFNEVLDNLKNTITNL